MTKVLQQKTTRQGFSTHIGFTPGEYANGIATQYLEIKAHHTQYQNNVHGGVIASLIDNCAGGAASSMVPQGKGVVTADMHINYLRPGTAPQLRARGRVIKSGRKLIVVQVEVFNHNGQMCAIGTLSFAVIDHRANQPPVNHQQQ